MSRYSKQPAKASRVEIVVPAVFALGTTLLLAFVASSAMGVLSQVAAVVAKAAGN